MRSTKEARAVTALTGSTIYDDDGLGGNQGGGTGKGQGKRGRGSRGSVLHPLRCDAKLAGEEIPSSRQTIVLFFVVRLTRV